MHATSMGEVKGRLTADSSRIATETMPLPNRSLLTVMTAKPSVAVTSLPRDVPFGTRIAIGRRHWKRVALSSQRLAPHLAPRLAPHLAA
jgi:hypothetical protein